MTGVGVEGEDEEEELPAVAMVMPLHEEGEGEGEQNMMMVMDLDANANGMPGMENLMVMPMPDVDLAGDEEREKGDDAEQKGGEAKRRRVRFESNAVSLEVDAALQVSRARYHAWQVDTSDITCDRGAAAFRRRKKARRMRFSGAREVDHVLRRPSSSIGDGTEMHRDVWEVMALPFMQMEMDNRKMRRSSSSPVTPFGLDAADAMMMEMEMPVPVLDAVDANMYVTTICRVGPPISDAVND